MKYASTSAKAAGKVVRAGHDAEQAGRILARIGGGVEGPVIGNRRDFERGNPAVFAGADFNVHVIVACESGGRQVFGARLHPFNGNAQNHRGNGGDDIARIDRNLVAEAAAHVGRNDVNLVLGNSGDERKGGAMYVRRLRGHVEGQPARGLVHVGHDPAGLEGRGMTARREDALLDANRRRIERTLGLSLVADLPMIDVVGLILAVVAQNDLIFLGSIRIDDRIERLVLDLDQFHGIGGNLAGLGNDAGNFLVLVERLAEREHHLFIVAVEGGQPFELGGVEIFAGDHRLDAGNR